VNPPRQARARSRPTIDALVSQIEAELSKGSRASFRHLLDQLTRGDLDDGSDLDEQDGARGEGYEDENDEEVDEEQVGRTPYGWGGPRKYSLSPPIRVEGGLSAKSKRGAIGESWWSKRFLTAVESALVGGRSTRGRSYARRGQVIELHIGAGTISAKVQGTRRTPYKVRIAMPVATDSQWDTILVSLASKALYAASMLAGELPHEIEEVFAAAGAPLMPSRLAHFSTNCTCPDWANPCKHVAAVCYIVAEQFDRDPFGLLAWRGRDREAVLGRLRELRGSGGAAVEEAQPETSHGTISALQDCLRDFWKAGPELASVHVRPVAADTAGAVLRQLPRGLLEVRGRDLSDVLAPAYQEMATTAERRALASSG